MSLDTEGQNALAAIISAHGGVEVRYGDQTTTGLQVLRNKQTSVGLMGQAGETISTVRVSAADIGEPERGARVQVGGQQVFVVACRTSCGVRVLECSDTQPIEGV